MFFELSASKANLRSMFAKLLASKASLGKQSEHTIFVCCAVGLVNAASEASLAKKFVVCSLSRVLRVLRMASEAGLIKTFMAQKNNNNTCGASLAKTT
jgi:hypothetical protein